MSEYEEELNRVLELDEESAHLVERNAEIHAKIKDELAENRAAREQVRDERDLILAQLLEDKGLEILTENVAVSKALYTANWAGGSGSSLLSDVLYKTLAPIPYVYLSYHRTSNLEPERSVKQLGLAIPRGADAEALDSMTETLEKIYNVQRKVMEGSDVGVSIDIRSESYVRFGSRDIRYSEEDGKWVIAERQGSFYNEVLSADTLREAVQHVAENYTHGATEEYEQKNPGWDNHQEDPYDDFAY